MKPKKKMTQNTDEDREKEQRRLKAKIKRDKAMKDWADRSAVIMALSMMAVALTLIAMVLGPWFVKEVKREANRDANIELKTAEKMLEHSKSEVIREKTIADRFALDRKNKKKDKEEAKLKSQAEAKTKADKRAKVKADNNLYVNAVFDNLKVWAKKNKMEGIYGCVLHRDATNPLDKYKWVDCTIYRDFDTNIDLLCSDNKGCGNAAISKEN